MDRYLEIRQAWRDAQTQAKALQMVEEAKRQLAAQGKAVQTEAEKKLLQQQLQNAMGNTALMCPRCKCGPVQHFACSDLGAHNGEMTRDGTRIDNRCPNCHFFSPMVRDWHKWDGVLRDFQQPAAATAVPVATQPPPPADNTVDGIVRALQRIASVDVDQALTAVHHAMLALARRGEIAVGRMPAMPDRAQLFPTIVQRPEERQRIVNAALDLLLDD